MSKKSPYGNCKKCNAPIQIPGLEASLCSAGCGWVLEKKIIQLEPSSIKGHKPKTSTPGGQLSLSVGGDEK